MPPESASGWDGPTKPARQKIIYNRYTVLSEPFRLVHESTLPKALEAIEEMLQKLTLRQEFGGL